MSWWGVERVVGAYYRLLVMLLIALFVVLTIVVSYQIFSRYAEFVPRYLWTLEVSRFCFVWMALLGAAVATREGTHFTVDIFPENLSGRLKQTLEVLMFASVTVVALVLLFGGIRFVAYGLERTSTTAGIPLAVVFAIIPLCGFSILVFAVERFLRTTRGEHPHKASGEESKGSRSNTEDERDIS